MNQQVAVWTDSLEGTTIESLTHSICHAFSTFPFMKHNKLIMRQTDSSNLQCMTTMDKHLIGNVLYGILHGGVTATMLDSIGGLQTMVELLHRESLANPTNNADYTQIKKQLGKVATTDFRVDYLAPGKGKEFIATAEVVRLGRRQSTTTMRLVNEQDTLIAIATASYVF